MLLDLSPGGIESGSNTIAIYRSSNHSPASALDASASSDEGVEHAPARGLFYAPELPGDGISDTIS
jgi:hypothetical protein